jgi:predicted TPR repeat methyltransferase
MGASEWDEYAAGWDDDPGARAYAAAAFDSLCEILVFHDLSLDGARVCDFGCGTGLLTERLIDRADAIDAIDSSPAMREVLTEKIARHGWADVHPKALLESAAERYDLIVCSSVCGFLEDYPGTVVALVAALQPDGLFVQWDWEADPSDADPHGLTRLEIRDALTAAGLESVQVDVGFRADFEGETMAPLMGSGRRPVD